MNPGRVRMAFGVALPHPAGLNSNRETMTTPPRNNAHQWREPTFAGPCARRVLVGGVSFDIPATARVKLVRGAHGIDFLHVNVGPRVHVLSRLGELDEMPHEMAARASVMAWRSLQAEPIT